MAWCSIWGLGGTGPEDPALGLGVADTHQGKGLGVALVDAKMAWARQARLPDVHLTVVKTNDRAVRLYERFGFVISGERVSPVDGLAYHRMLWRNASP